MFQFPSIGWLFNPYAQPVVTRCAPGLASGPVGGVDLTSSRSMSIIKGVGYYQSSSDMSILRMMLGDRLLENRMWYPEKDQNKAPQNYDGYIVAFG